MADREKFNRRDLDDDLNGWSVTGVCQYDPEDGLPASVTGSLVLLTCGNKERVSVSAEYWQTPEQRQAELARVRNAAQALDELAAWMEERIEEIPEPPEDERARRGEVTGTIPKA